MTIRDHMEESYNHLKALVDADGLPHSCIAGLKRMTLEPAFSADGEEPLYRMTLGSIRERH